MDVTPEERRLTIAGAKCKFCAALDKKNLLVISPLGRGRRRRGAHWYSAATPCCGGWSGCSSCTAGTQWHQTESELRP